MKKFLSIMFFILTIVPFIAQEAKAQSAVQISNAQIVNYRNVAKDSTLSNSATSYSNTFALLTYNSNQKYTKNFLESASICVTAKQTNDSIRATVYLEIGAITGGTKGSTYSQNIYEDSLYTGHETVFINLSSYSMYPEAKIAVVAKSAGNGFQETWSAFMAGVGYTIGP